MTTEEKQGSEYALTVRRAAGLSAEAWPDERIGAIKRTVAPKEAGSAEIAMFLTVADRYQLDPFLKQIWLAKDKGKLIILTGRDSFITVAERTQGYGGFDSGVVHAKDTFQVIRNGDDIRVIHEINGFERGAIVGAYCVAFRHGRRPALKLREWKDYKHLHGKDNWKNYGPDMIETRVITAALRQQYTISGLYTPDEFVDGELLPDGDRMQNATLGKMDALKEKLEGKVIEAEVVEVEVIEEGSEEVPDGTAVSTDADPPHEDASDEPGATQETPPEVEPTLPQDEEDAHSELDNVRKMYHATIGELCITDAERKQFQVKAFQDSEGRIAESSTEWAVADYREVIYSLKDDGGAAAVKGFVGSILAEMDVPEVELGRIRSRVRYACEQSVEKRRELLDKLHGDLLDLAEDQAETETPEAGEGGQTSAL